MRNALVARDFVPMMCRVPAAASSGNRTPEGDRLPALIDEAPSGSLDELDEIEAAEGHCHDSQVANSATVPATREHKPKLCVSLGSTRLDAGCHTQALTARMAAFRLFTFWRIKSHLPKLTYHPIHNPNMFKLGASDD